MTLHTPVHNLRTGSGGPSGFTTYLMLLHGIIARGRMVYLIYRIFSNI